MNIRSTKKQCKQQILEQHWKPSWMTAAFLVISIALTLLSMKLAGYLDYVANIYTNFMAELVSMEDSLTSGYDPAAYSQLYSALDGVMADTPFPDVPTAGIVLAWAVLLMLPVFRAGHTGCCLKAARNETYGIRNLFDGFRAFFRALGVYLLRILLTGIGLLLFVLPGIYLWYRYRFASFVLFDHPEYNVFRVLRESAKLSRGWTIALFVLDFSFLGWYIVSYLMTVLLSLPALEVYYRPVAKMTRAHYYMTALEDRRAWEARENEST